MNKFIGWLITMNLVNIFWVFFRAKDLGSAIKVIRGMVDINNLLYLLKNPFKILFETEKYRNLVAQLNYFGTKELFMYLVLSVFIVLLFKNSIQKLKNFRESRSNIFEMIFYLIFGIISLSQMSTFLYFNF